MAQQKTRTVEYYRCWAGNGGDSGTWDTDFIDIPAQTPDEQVEEAIRRAAQKIDWLDGDAPVIVGFYCDAEDRENREYRRQS